ncbi:hypothetical protein CGRA01v4_06894 [Colletotrichum graminicola]|nr:hypothetical protein CGRA01v4_06894 [Colletotrichum graminicola]
MPSTLSLPHDPVCPRPILTESRLVRGSHAEPTGGISGSCCHRPPQSPLPRYLV